VVDQLLVSLEKTLLSSPLLGLGASFLAGILLSFSPCIWPLIPITLGVIGVTAASTKARGSLIVAIFVLGIASLYTVLGIVSSILGLFLGKLFINPIIYLVLASVFFFLGMSNFKIIKLKMPISLQYSRWVGKNLFSVFILGVISGLGIIPCSLPVLGAILSLISLKGDVVYGGTALFLFSIGYGSILFIIGTSATLIRRLPKQSRWFIIVERSLGMLFLIIGVYFLLKAKVLLG